LELQQPVLKLQVQDQETSCRHHHHLCKHGGFKNINIKLLLNTKTSKKVGDLTATFTKKNMRIQRDSTNLASKRCGIQQPGVETELLPPWPRAPNSGRRWDASWTNISPHATSYPHPRMPRLGRMVPKVWEDWLRQTFRL